MALGPTLAALTFGDDFIFLEELLGGLSKALLRKENPRVILATLSEIPVLGKLGRKCQTFPLRRSPPLLAADGSNTLSHPAVAAPAELNFSIQNLMTFHGPPTKRRR